MKTNRLFLPDQTMIDRLVTDYPFAQLISMEGERLVCTPLPLLLERRADEAQLIGHFAKTNPQVALLRRQPRALAVFMGEHGYISPSWMRDRAQAPTWNYQTVHFELEVAFDEGGTQPHEALERLVTHMERDRPQAWSSGELGPRYAQLSRAVIAFRGRVIATHAKFKLGQNERPDVYADILEGLYRTGQPRLMEASIRAESRAAGGHSPTS